MKLVSLLVIGGSVAAAALVLPSCNSDPLKGCTFAHIEIDPSYAFVAVGDSTRVSAQVTSDCSAVGPAVDFSVKSTALATVHATSPTTAVLQGVAVGKTVLYATPRDYPSNRDSVGVQVIAPNP